MFLLLSLRWLLDSIVVLESVDRSDVRLHATARFKSRVKVLKFCGSVKEACNSEKKEETLFDPSRDFHVPTLTTLIESLSGGVIGDIDIHDKIVLFHCY